MTRIGLLARATDRGLGIQTWEFYRALNPQTLVIDLGDSPRFPQHYDRFPGAQVVKYRGLLPKGRITRFLESVDAVYTAETTYSPQLGAMARQTGTEVVVHINPEFHQDAHNATRWWAPTSWRLPHLPAGTEVVPVPVATDRFTPVELHEGPTRWLHVAGKSALGDRNGTDAVLAAIPHLTRPCSITIAAQDDRTFDLPHNPLVSVRFASATANYWDLYRYHDALVLPRRYGGLCLPVQESMAAGMAVLMTNLSPNAESWPVATVNAQPGRRERMPAGRIPVGLVSHRDVARGMDALADPQARQERQQASLQWAQEHSWSVWADRYRDLLTPT